jgi:hypothetical protein
VFIASSQIYLSANFCPALYTDVCCADRCHHAAIGLFAEAICNACLSAADSCIPQAGDRQSGERRDPGWLECMEPFCPKSLFERFMVSLWTPMQEIALLPIA